jgi:hypothetical protein
MTGGMTPKDEAPMLPSRPIGHIAGNIAITAVTIAHRVKSGMHDAIHVCWLTDDGCIYLQQRGHDVARAIERTAPETIIARFRKQPGMTWQDIHEDLQQARIDFAHRAIAEAMAA